MRYVVAVILSALSLNCLAAESARFPTNEDLRHVREIIDPRLSPDGKLVLMHVLDDTAAGGRTHVWLTDVDGGEPRQLTFSAEGDAVGERFAQWMPDGRSIIFVAKRRGHIGMFQLPMNGGEAKEHAIKVPVVVDASRLTGALPPASTEDKTEPPKELTADVSAYAVSPDGLTIALIARDPETPGEKKQKEAKADAVWVDHDEHASRLYLLDPASGKVTPIPVPIDVQSFAWSEDGAQLVVICKGMNSASDLGPDKSTWIVTLADIANPRRITEVPATVNKAVWAHDGRSLFYSAQSRQDAPPGFSEIYQYDLQLRTTRALTRGPGDAMSGDLIALPDGSTVRPIATGLDVTIVKDSPTAGGYEEINLPLAAMSAVRTNAARNGWLFLGSSAGREPELHYAATLHSATRILKIPALVSKDLKSAAAKRIEWKNGGLKIQGLLFLPPAAATNRVPLIVDVHGGPMGMYLDAHDPFIDFLVGQGWAVLRSNPRGSLGRGAAFAAAIKNDLGGADYRDIMKGVDYVLSTEQIDSTRMALMGYSYGGEMAGFVVGKTTRFKAIVSGAPVIDQYSEYGTEDDSWYDRWYFGKPWERPRDAWRQSPLAYVGAAKTPFLLIHGESDTVDPIGQSQEMYRALRQVGSPVDFVTYPRNGHGPMARAIFGRPSSEPWHGFDARRRIVEFIGKAFGQKPREDG